MRKQIRNRISLSGASRVRCVQDILEVRGTPKDMETGLLLFGSSSFSYVYYTVS